MIGVRWSVRTMMLLGAAIALAHPAFADTPAAQNVTYVFQGTHVTTDAAPPAMPAVKPTPVDAESLPAPAGVKTTKLAGRAHKTKIAEKTAPKTEIADAAHGLPRTLPPAPDDRMALNNIDSALPQINAPARGGARETIASLDSASEAPPDYIHAIHNDIAEARAHPLPSSLNHAAHLPIDMADAAPVARHNHAALPDDDDIAIAAPESLAVADNTPVVSHADYVAEETPVQDTSYISVKRDDDEADLAAYTAPLPRDDTPAPAIIQKQATALEAPGAPQTIRTYATPLVPPSPVAHVAEAEECQPFTTLGGRGHATGTACRGADGIWRIREEHYAAPVRTTQVASNWPRFGIGF